MQAVYGKEVEQLRITNKRSPLDYYLELSGLNPESVWYKIRKYLLKSCGEIIDKVWFSRLEAIEEDTTCNKLILKHHPVPLLGIGLEIVTEEFWRRLAAARIILLSL